MASTYNFAGGKDVLRQECADLLRSYVPSKASRKPADTQIETPAQIKKEVREKAEARAEAIKQVMQMDREMAIQRNKKAFEDFLQSLIDGRVNTPDVIPSSRTVPKRKNSTPKPASKVLKSRKASNSNSLDQMHAYPYPMQPQFDPAFQQQYHAFQPQFNQMLQDPSQLMQAEQNIEEPEPLAQPSELDLYQMYQL